MNLVCARGLRTVYTWSEVCELLQMPRRRVKHLVDTGRLIKASTGAYPFMQRDLNQFIVRFNAGEIVIGCRCVKGGVRASDGASV